MPIINEPRMGLGTYGASTKGVTVAGTTKVYNTLAQRDADKTSGMFAFVRDASADPTVKTGFAIYYKKASGWKKIFEEEAMDMDIAELVTIQWENVIGKPSSPIEDIDRAVQLINMNKEKLDQIQIRDSNIYFKETIGDSAEEHVLLKDRHIKWLQLVRPIVSDKLYCEIKIYDNPNLDGDPIFRLDSYAVPSNFYYYDIDTANNKIRFTQLGSASRYIPEKTIGNFIIADISTMLSTDDAYIEYSWYTKQGNEKTIVSTNICVYPALTPTNSYSVGLNTLNWNDI